MLEIKVRIQNMGNKNYLHFFRNIKLDAFYDQVNNMKMIMKPIQQIKKHLINQTSNVSRLRRLQRLKRLRRLGRN